MDVNTELAIIVGLARVARDALADEHEGNLRQAVTDLKARADALHALVTTW